LADIRFGLIATESSRTRAYLAALEAHDLHPSAVVFLRGHSALSAPVAVPYFDNLTPALTRIEALDLPCVVVTTANVNDASVAAAVAAAEPELFVFSGPGGAIVREPLFATGKRFLHVHPGLLPDYRGSTTLYYSLLERGECGASAILLDREIDAGPTIARRRYEGPADRSLLDHGFDPYIRSDLLVRVLTDFRRTGRLDAHPQPEPPEECAPYYIMHPVLRHVAILSAGAHA
jgi:methionyl-tRNA formyltransferase